MNNFENCVPCTTSQGIEPTRNESLTEIMAISKSLGVNALDKVNLIKCHMFGDGRLDGIEKCPQMCFMDAAREHCAELKALNVELQAIIDILGCQD